MLLRLSSVLHGSSQQFGPFLLLPANSTFSILQGHITLLQISHKGLDSLQSTCGILITSNIANFSYLNIQLADGAKFNSL